MNLVIKKITESLENLLYTENGTCPGCGIVLFQKNLEICPRCQASLHNEDIFTNAFPDEHADFLQIRGIVSQGFLIRHRYKGIVKSVIHQMKYRFRKNLCESIGRFLAQSILTTPWATHFDQIITIPSSKERMDTWGYNQCEHIVKGMLEVFAEVEFFPKYDPKVLIRDKRTKRQQTLRFSDRIDGSTHHFVADPNRIHGQSVLLIDDVITTGATLCKATETLRTAGAKAVFHAVYAST